MALTTSPSLLVRIRNPDDQDAWEQFVAVYTSIVRDYCIQRRLQPTDVDDVVQDVMASVCKSIRTFEYDPAKGRFRAWFGTIAANRIKSFLDSRARRSQKTAANFDGTNEWTASQPYADPDSEWVAIFSEKILRTAYNRIRPDFSDVAWECFQATWIRNEDSAKVAQELGIAVNSVYGNKFKVLKRLEIEVKMLAEDAPFNGPSPHSSS